MKKIVLVLMFLPVFSFAQQKSCCSASSTEKFAMLATNDKFTAAHEAPLPFEFMPAKGTMVTYKTSDGKTTNAFEITATTKSDNWLIVFHEWWGLNDYIKQEAEKISGELPNVNVIAVDLYDGYVASTPQEAQEKMSAMKDERSRAIVQSTITRLGSKAKIATLGWCMGGGWSLQTSIMTGKQGAACVMYYGMPELEQDKLKDLNCDVLGIFAGRDEWITKDVVSKFEESMSSAGKTLIVNSFDAYHAFANPSNPKHDKQATTDAHKLAIAFLLERLK